MLKSKHVDGKDLPVVSQKLSISPRGRPREKLDIASLSQNLDLVLHDTQRTVIN